MGDPESPLSSLSDTQREILRALVERHDESRGPVKGETIAADAGLHVVTVSARMQDLRALQLVRSTPGPRGGYEPSVKARDVLAHRRTERPADTPIATGSERIGDVRVREVALPGVRDPDHCRAVLSIAGSLPEFTPGQSVDVGPLPGTGLSMEGVVVEGDPTESTLTVEVEAMRASYG